MLEKLAKCYLQFILRKAQYSDIEIVVRNDGWTYRKRDKAKEASIRKTLEMIK